MCLRKMLVAAGCHCTILSKLIVHSNFSKGKITFPVYKDGVRTLLSAEDTCIHYFVEETGAYTNGEYIPENFGLRSCW